MAAAFRKAQKSRQKNHQERQQLGFRKHLGLLEKKKDYKLRAEFCLKKQNYLSYYDARVLKKKKKSPFLFVIIIIIIKDGVHVIKQPKEELTEEQLKVMRTQDLKYVELKRVAEGKEISLTLTQRGAVPLKKKKINKIKFLHHFNKNVEQFDLATHLKTAPELVDRVYNRPTIETLRTETVKGATNPFQLQKLARQRKRQYSILKQRIEREKKMFVIEQKLQTRKDLMDKTHKVKVKKETVDSPAIYKFKFQRKR
uniref:U3 small nucleolar RNA-associated protein 11 n=1 Tax=Latimeria chalumnae TaxID=7897 RepID=H3ADY2_LATCH